MGDPKRKHSGWKGSHPRPNSLPTNKHGTSRPPSYDSIQGRVQREGITARNLIKYNVPLENGYSYDRSANTSGRVRTPSSSYSAIGVKKSPSAASSPRKTTSTIGIGGQMRLRKPRDDRARYWGHMLDTLKRTIDEIYTACEEDESEVECREVILILEHSKKDFHSLIEKMKKLREYENADESQRPTSLAWDERKTSPGKPIMKQVFLERTLNAAVKVAAAVSPGTSISENPTTWADRVRGAVVKPRLRTDTKRSDVEEGELKAAAGTERQSNEPDNASAPPALDTEVVPTESSELDTVKTADTAAELLLAVEELKINIIDAEEDHDDGGGWEKVEKRQRGGSKSKAMRHSGSNSSNPMKSNSHPTYWKNHGGNGSCSSSTTSNLHIRLRSESCSSNGSNLRRGYSMSETNISVRSDGSSRGLISSNTVPLQNIQISHSTNNVKARSRSSTNSSNAELVKEKEISPESAYSSVVKFGRTEKTQKTDASHTSDTEEHVSIPVEAEPEPCGEHEKETEAEVETEEKTEKEEHKEEKTEKVEEEKAAKVDEETKDQQSDSEEQKNTKEKDTDIDVNRADVDDDDNGLGCDVRHARHMDSDGYDAEAEDGIESENAVTPHTSVDFTSGEEDEDRTLLQIDKELEDAENEETALTTQLESEEKNYRQQVDAAATAIAASAYEGSLSWEDIVEEQKRMGGMSWDLLAALDPDCYDESDTPPDSTLCGSLAPLSLSSFTNAVDKFRTPGRGVQMHERLSSPSRKRSIESSNLRTLQEKQDKAKQLRKQVIGARTDKIRELMSKVEEARELKEELLAERKELQEQRMRRADIKRKAQLERKVRKAHDEETKGREIAFIQSLEQEQKQHNILAKHQESEQRLQEIQEERKRKQEEKAVREAAVEERRRMLDETRQARLLALQQKRESREREIASRAYAKEKIRQENARAKELERESKRAAIIAQEKQQIEDLKVKIQKKQEDTERRHLEQLREISRKAFEMSVLKHSTEDADDAPPLEPYASNKWCTVCHTMINSEVILQSHLRGKKHLANFEKRMETNWEKSQIERFNLEHIVDAPKDEPDPKQQADKERKKNMKKRIKKLKQRMNSRGAEFQKENAKSGVSRPDSGQNPKLVKFVKEVTRYLAIADNGPWVQRRVSALDKSMGEALRCLETKLHQNQDLVIELHGDTVLCNVLALIVKSDQTVLLPERSFQLTCQVYQAVCANNWNASYVALFSNHTALLLEALSFRLNLFIGDGFGRDSTTNQLLEASNLPSDLIAVSLMETLEAIVSSLATRCPRLDSVSDTCSTGGDSVEGKSAAGPSGDQLSARIQDFVSYLVCLGVIDKLTVYLSNVRGPLDANGKAATFVRVSLIFFESILKLMALKQSLEGKKSKKATNEDPTQLLTTVLATDLCGLVSLLYGMLLHSGAPSKRDSSPPPLAEVTLAVTMGGLRLINAMAELSLNTTQLVLGEEGTVLQLRHIFSYLLWYCGHMSSGRSSSSMEVAWRPLLHEVVLCVGHYTVGHADNQNCLQFGQSPTVLQLLCQLPFEYFSDRRRTQVLYPTLIAACYENDANSLIVKAELSLSLLANFVEEHIKKESEVGSAENDQQSRRDKRMDLRARFSRDLWPKALSYFTR